MRAGLLQRPGGFLALFALVTALSLPAWDVLSLYYMRALIWLVNCSLGALSPQAMQLPTTLVRDGVYPGMAGAIALFVVTPRQTWRWRLGWVGLLMTIMLAVHATVLLAETMHALEGTTPAPLLLRLARTWGTSAIVIWVWFAAVRGARPGDPAVSPQQAD